MAEWGIKKPIVFGVAGGTGSGKTTVARQILDMVGAEQVAYLAHDAYYRDSPQLSWEERLQMNYDHPSSLETELMHHHVEELLAGHPVEMPVYDFTNHRRKMETIHILPSPIIIVEGILVFTDKPLRELMDVKIFVDTDADVRFIRRLKRDVEDRGRSVESVIKQYLNTVRPMHLEFVEPSKRHADVIIPVGGRNQVAIHMVVSLLRELLHDSG
ncbi:MAG: uridine kinase [Ardenticatenaceae bacterium]|nr:uridine kinase [Ardenticatenaceae bacterium]